MMRWRRANLVWLTMLSAMGGVAVLTPGTPPLIQLATLGVVGGTVAASLLQGRAPAPAEIAERLRAPLEARQQSAEAREAAQRARGRSASSYSDGLLLLDVGLIAQRDSGRGPGLVRTRAISADDDSVRPFVRLRVGNALANQEVRVRFEILDGRGRAQYVHEQKAYLRDGTIDVLADHQMPLRGGAPGDYTPGNSDLRVSVDSVPVALLSFTLSPGADGRFVPHAQRTRRLADDPSANQDAVGTGEPLTLEELMRRQGRSRGAGDDD